jgi:UDP-N-acetylglucosamine--N-acetylmuramyl-(pentapeptide) pyrophosphoryl-undecaprenol N-acetylglucosamine transferase
VYPALAVLKALQAGEGSRWQLDRQEILSPLESNNLEVLWVGGEGGIEVDLISREEIEFTTIPAAGVHGVGLRVLPGNLWQIIKGYFSARRIIKEFHPQVMFFTGGYLAVPVALAGRSIISRKFRPRILVYVPDIEPGLALRLLAILSDRIAVTVEDSMSYFSNRSKIDVTGYPVRNELSMKDHEAARTQLSIDRDLPTLLVFGGSKGARSINRAILACLADLLTNMQVIHISGQLDWPEIEAAKKRLPVDLQARYHAYPYLYQEMGAALSVADIVLSRAGASVLGEFPLFGLPAILVPYPYAWRYQEVNAKYLENRGAALVLQDQELEQKLFSTIQSLLNDQNQRERMSQAMLSMATPKAAASIADLLHGLVPTSSLGRI